jgi:VWFA-related protein
MNRKNVIFRIAMIVASVAIIFLSARIVVGQNQKGELVINRRNVTILVTVDAQTDRTREIAAKLQAEDFAVLEEKQIQRIISVKKASESPPIIAVLIQDDLVSSVSNEIPAVKEFIRHLPEGSRVMTAYLTAGSLRLTQNFTTDRMRAAESLRIVTGNQSATTYSPYIQMIEALKRFDEQPAGRRIVLLMSDGLDVSQGLRDASLIFSLYLGQAISEAQQRGIAIFSFYAPSVGLTSVSRLAVNYGQGSLNRVADETGGEAFFSGTSFVTFDPHFRELNDLLNRQWLITYQSTNSGTGFRRIEVTTDFDLHLHHPAGYRVQDALQSWK